MSVFEEDVLKLIWVHVPQCGINLEREMFLRQVEKLVG